MSNQQQGKAPRDGESTPSTEHMMHRLQEESDFQRFVDEYAPTFIDQDVAKQLDHLLRKYLVMKNEAVKASGIERHYAYHILAGDRRAGRDKLIRFAIGIGVDLQDAQRLLRIAQEGELYPKVKRDAAIIHCIVGKKTVIETTHFLDDVGCDPLE